MLGGRRGWVQSRKGDPIQHNSYPTLAVTWKPQLGSQAAGALQWNDDPGDMEWGHICVPRKSDEDVECECFYVNCCVCCLSSPTAPGQGIPFYEVVICKRGAPGASSWTWYGNRFLAICLRRRGGAPLVLPRGAPDAALLWVWLVGLDAAGYKCPCQETWSPCFTAPSLAHSHGILTCYLQKKLRSYFWQLGKWDVSKDWRGRGHPGYAQGFRWHVFWVGGC